MKKTIFTIGLCVISFTGQAQLTLELVKDINPSGGSVTEYLELAEFQDHLYSVADEGVHDREIWVTNGNEAGTFFKSISSILGLIVLDDQLFFAANDGSNGPELWHSDGTETGNYSIVLTNTFVP